MFANSATKEHPTKMEIDEDPDHQSLVWCTFSHRVEFSDDEHTHRLIKA